MTLYFLILSFLSGWFLREQFSDMELSRKIVNLLIVLIIVFTINWMLP